MGRLATSAGLPESLGEFLDVWCADALGSLSDQDRRRVVGDIYLMCEGGVPWPTRLHVQRLVEIAQGRVTEEAVQGELLELYAGGIDGAISRLADPDLRAAAIYELGQFQPSVAAVRQITAAAGRGDLTENERVSVLRRAMRLPDLPDPIPLPEHLVPIPPGYPSPVHPAGGRHGPVRGLSSRLVPAMVSYVPQRVEAQEVPVQDPRPASPWAPTRVGTAERRDGRGVDAPFHDGVDAFLRDRGWFSSRDRGHCERDEWIWPPSADEPWWQPTIIDFDGVRFRVRLASASLMEAPCTQYLVGEREIRREIASIEEWSSPD